MLRKIALSTVLSMLLASTPLIVVADSGENYTTEYLESIKSNCPTITGTVLVASAFLWWMFGRKHQSPAQQATKPNQKNWLRKLLTPTGGLDLDALHRRIR